LTAGATRTDTTAPDGATAAAATSPAGNASIAAGSRSSEAEPEDRLVGATIDRYRVEARLGAGGMGVVYAAYDPALDRRVALKVLPAIEQHQRAHLEGRLRREAQALARLAHPNVVAVHDVGVAEHSVFLAMQLVDGVTADGWLEREPRTAREILEVLVAVGRGLAAAHDAGIVHRDVKPSNVLIDGQRRVFIGDFGLARNAHEVDAEPAAVASLLEQDLTHTGAVLGTPPYMAPEQHRSEPATPRSDQFAFCVMAWRALFGGHPFSAGAWDPAEAAAAMAGDAVREPARRRGVSSRLVRALRRGLRHDPAQRWPTMDALIAEIAPRSRAAWWWGGGVSLAGVAVAVAVTAQIAPSGAGPPPCEDGRAQLAGVWDAARAAQLRTVFGQIRPGWGDEVAARLVARLDGYAAAWRKARVEACEATRVRAEQSPTTLDLRIYCLDRRLGELDARVDALLDQPDLRIVGEAQPLIAAQAPVESCGDITALAAPPPPTNPVTRARFDALGRRLADLTAGLDLGRVRASIEPLRVLGRQAHDAGFDALEADALVRLAWSEVTTGERAAGRTDLDAALAAAARGKDDVALAKISLRLMFLTGVIEVSREADSYQQMAETMIARLDHRDDLAARLTDYTAVRHALAGRTQQAIAEGERAVALWKQAKDPIEAADTLQNLAAMYHDADQFDKAEQRYREVIARYTKEIGERHPTVATAMWNLGALQRDLGNRESIATLHKAREIFADTEGSATPDVAHVDLQLARSYDIFGDLVRAEHHARDAVAVLERVIGADSSELADPLDTLATIVHQRGGIAEAQALEDRALAIAEAAHDDKEIGSVLTGQADAYLAGGRPERALAAATRAVQVLDKAEAGWWVGDARFVRAQALWATGARSEAHAEAARAQREIAAGATAAARRQRARLDAWLTHH
jgi:tetratricopeptide (TPR) repeat protein